MIERTNLPNSMDDILDQVKEKLREQRIPFKAKKHKLTTDVNVPRIVEELLKE